MSNCMAGKFKEHVCGQTEEFGPFLAALRRLGFKLRKQDVSNDYFVVFRLTKRPEAVEAQSGSWPELKPCVYKKR